MPLPAQLTSPRSWRATPASAAAFLSRGEWRPYRHHAFVAYHLRETIRTGGRLLVTMPPQHGKALALDTPIATPTGWTTIGDLEPGDLVLDDLGAPTAVVAKSEVWEGRPCYEVHGDDGDRIVADAAHEWPVRLDLRSAERLATSQLLAKARGKRARSRLALPLDLPTADLPVDPYVLGVWLGDGDTRQAGFTAGEVDAGHLLGRIEAAGYPTRSRAAATHYGIRGGLQVALREAGVLGEKHVPAAYLRASRAQRLALLQGLIDTDGHVAPDGQVEFCATRRALADAVRELVWGLGAKAQLLEGRASIYGRDCGPKWRVMFYMADAATIPRKAARCRTPAKSRRYLDARPVESVPVQCIQVAASSALFLAGRSLIPTHNSLLCSLWLPVWVLEHDPTAPILHASYEAEFSAEWGGRVRDAIRERRDVLGYRLRSGHGPGENLLVPPAAKRWRTTAGGGMSTAGVGGPMTGRPGRVVIIDDPHKNYAEAHSPTIRRNIWQWYLSVARTRLAPGAAVIIPHTRWHEGDLTGLLLKAAEEEGGERWKQLRLPAIAEEDEPAPPAGLGRKKGEALWPERYPLAWLEQTRATLGEYLWAGMYQGRPTPAAGGMFLEARWATVPATPAGVTSRVRYWDLAASEETGSDWAAGARVAVSSDGVVYIEDVSRLQGLDFEVARRMAEVRAADTDAVRVRLEQEPGSGGKAWAQILLRTVYAGHPDARAIPASKSGGDKIARARPLITQQQAGNVRLVAGPWNAAFIEEANLFPHGEHDDQVDAAALGYLDLGPGGFLEPGSAAGYILGR